MYDKTARIDGDGPVRYEVQLIRVGPDKKPYILLEVLHGDVVMDKVPIDPDATREILTAVIAFWDFLEQQDQKQQRALGKKTRRRR